MSGDATITNTGAVTVSKINGTSLSGLATGILKNTAGTGIPSIALAGTDYVAPNIAIAGASNTKITYDAKGLVTAGAAATLASADFANQGSTTTVLHGNAAGNPSFGAVSLAADVSGVLPLANGGTNANLAAVNGGVVYSGASAMGITPVGTSGQYLQSTGAGTPVWAQPGPVSVQVLTSGTTYTRPAGITAIIIELVGGGGGSGGIVSTGGSSDKGCGAGGGGGGAYTRKLIVSPAATYSFTIGAGGTAGANTGANGGAGGATSFNGGAITAPGGSGGTGESSTGIGTVAAGGAGGVVGIGGDFMARGGAGDGGFSARYIGCGGQGGNSIFGGGAISGMAAVQGVAAGSAGNAYGGGASGPGSISSGTNQAATAGSAGAAGVIIIYEYK